MSKKQQKAKAFRRLLGLSVLNFGNIAFCVWMSLNTATLILALFFVLPIALSSIAEIMVLKGYRISVSVGEENKK
jgi:Cu/Ag efflux pump CusA